MTSWFSLPLPKPDPTKLPDEPRSSDPDWLLNRGFKDRLHFEAWNVFEKEVDAASRDLSRLETTSSASTSKEKREINWLLKPVRKDLEDEGYRNCWSERTIESRIAAPAWRAINEARQAVMSIRKPNGKVMFSDLYFVPQKEVRSEKYAERIGRDLGRKVKISNPEHIIPDFCCYAAATDAESDKSPLATVELKGSRAWLIHKLIDATSSKNVAEYFDWIFAKKPDPHHLSEHYHVTKRLSQALTQAFHTESGCGALYNLVYALFFFIEGKKLLKSGRTRVVVKISRVYRCDTFPSNLHAFTAWTFVVDKLCALRNKLRKRQLLDAIEFISTSSREHEHDDDSPPSSSSDESFSSPSTPSSGSSSPDKKRQKGNGGQKSGNKKSGSKSSSKKRPLDVVIRDQPLSYATALSKRLLEGFETYLAMSGIEDAQLQVEAYRNDGLVRNALDCDIEVLGEGAFGVVRRALINGVEAAVKYCNRCAVGTHQYLYNEILMYCHIASTSPHLLDYSIPNLVAVGFDDWAGPVLITEMVGEDVYSEDGILRVGHQQVNPEVSSLLCARAVRCLKALHKCGILHRDIALRNLRARISLKEKDCRNEDIPLTMNHCAAWWIDLGFSKIGGSCKEFDFELEQCISLFA